MNRVKKRKKDGETERKIKKIEEDKEREEQRGRETERQK